MVVVLYGTAIQDAIAKGDLAEMKELLLEADKHLGEWGNMPTAVDMLKVEILKEEAKLRGDRKSD